VTVGGGPTGIELAAEVDEMVQDHLLAIYQHLKGQVTISVYDVADRALGAFGEKLSEYAMSQFRARDAVEIHTDRNIESVEANVLHVKEEGKVGFGVCVWAVGNKACSLVEDRDVRKTEGLPRIATDRYLKVLAPGNEKGDEHRAIIPNVYALGDAADILDHSLPTAAEVAVQKSQVACGIYQQWRGFRRQKVWIQSEGACGVYWERRWRG
jgi:NADH:ubiquinone reductase (non-electrogenic)